MTFKETNQAATGLADFAARLLPPVEVLQMTVTAYGCTSNAVDGWCSRTLRAALRASYISEHHTASAAFKAVGDALQGVMRLHDHKGTLEITINPLLITVATLTRLMDAWVKEGECSVLLQCAPKHGTAPDVLISLGADHRQAAIEGLAKLLGSITPSQEAAR